MAEAVRGWRVVDNTLARLDEREPPLALAA
jgi:hypothetical protein